MQEFYYRLWVGDEKVPIDSAVTDMFGGGRAQVRGQPLAHLIHPVWNHGKTFVQPPERESTHQWISAIVAVSKVIIKATPPQATDHELLNLVNLFSRFHMLASPEPLM